MTKYDYALRLSLAGTMVLMLLGPGSAASAQEQADATAFPIGTLTSTVNPDHALIFRSDGTGSVAQVGRWEVFVRYGVSGDFCTEMMFSYAGSERDGSQTPATYYWDFDGEQLTFDLWGEDLRPHRESIYAGNTWRLVEAPASYWSRARTSRLAHRSSREW